MPAYSVMMALSIAAPFWSLFFSLEVQKCSCEFGQITGFYSFSKGQIKVGQFRKQVV
jgi:hypothetical protein